MVDEKAEAGVKRAAALSDREADYVRALQVERNGYVIRGLNDRVAQVDVELAKLGVDKPKPARVVKSED